MIRYYYFIECLETRICKHHAIYVVKVGQSSRDLSDLAFVERFVSKSNDYYFAKAGNDSSSFVVRLEKTYHMQRIVITIADLRRRLKKTACRQDVVNLSLSAQVVANIRPLFNS